MSASVLHRHRKPRGDALEDSGELRCLQVDGGRADESNGGGSEGNGTTHLHFNCSNGVGSQPRQLLTRCASFSGACAESAPAARARPTPSHQLKAPADPTEPRARPTTRSTAGREEAAAPAVPVVTRRRKQCVVTGSGGAGSSTARGGCRRQW